MLLYHGSDTEIQQPDISFNTGFADLGAGFYLTDNYEAAVGRARSRARKTGAARGVVSTFKFDEAQLPWITWDSKVAPTAPDQPFDLRSGTTDAGIAAWANYIKACRSGHTTVGNAEPAVVRAWIATEDIEMVCAGFAPDEELASFIDPQDLIVQYCFRSQQAIDELLVFVRAE